MLATMSSPTQTEPRMAVPRHLASLATTTSEFAIHGVTTPFVGRRAELEAVYEAARAVMAEGRLRQVALVGPEGVGKTRLVHELRKIIERTGRPVVFHEAAAADGPTSAALLCGQILRRRFDLSLGDGDEVVRRKLGAGLEGLVRPARHPEAVAQLGSLLGLQIPPVLLYRGIPHPAAFRRRAVKTLAKVLERDAERAMQVLVFDQVHELEPEHAHWLTELLEDLALAPVLVVFVAREAVGAPPALPARVAPLTQVEVRPLQPDAVRSLLSSLLGSAPDPSGAVRLDALDGLVEAAAGNPRRLDELVRLLVKRGAIEVGGGRLTLHEARLTPPERVPTDPELAATARLADLEKGEREVLTAASVFGDHFWFDGVLSQLWAGPRGERQGQPDEDRLEGKLHRILLELIKEDVVRYVPSSQVQGVVELLFTSMHERRALHDAVAGDELTALRRRAGRWMLEVHPIDPRTWFRRAAELLDAAGCPREAAEAWVRSAEAAARQYEPGEALRAFDQAAARLDATNAREMRRIHAGRARVYEDTGELARALEHWNAVFRCARVLSDRPLAAEAMVAQGRLLRRLGDATRAGEVLARARAAFDDLELPAGRASTLEELGRLVEETGGEGAFAESTQHHERARTLWQETGDLHAVARVTLHLGRLAMGLGQLRDARRLAEDALGRFKQDDDGRGTMACLNLLGSIEHLVGRHAVALDLWRQAVRMTAATGARGRYALLSVNLADAYAAAGSPREALERAREALEVALEVGHRLAEGYARWRLGALLLREDVAQASRHAADAVRLGQDTRSLRLEALGARLLAQCDARALELRMKQDPGPGPRDVQAVEAAFAAAQQLAERLGDVITLMRTLTAYVTFLEAHGDRRYAKRLRDRADGLWRRVMDGAGGVASAERTDETPMVLPPLDEVPSERATRQLALAPEPIYD